MAMEVLCFNSSQERLLVLGLGQKRQFAFIKMIAIEMVSCGFEESWEKVIFPKETTTLVN